MAMAKLVFGANSNSMRALEKWNNNNNNNNKSSLNLGSK
jgi:hypothetical protein